MTGTQLCRPMCAAGEAGRKRETERGMGKEGWEEGDAFPSRDMSAMCADETGRCAKPGFDRHLSSYQRARRNCSDPTAFISHKYENYIRGLSRGLWSPISPPRVVNYGHLLAPRGGNASNRLDTFASDRKIYWNVQLLLLLTESNLKGQLLMYRTYNICHVKKDVSCFALLFCVQNVHNVSANQNVGMRFQVRYLE